MAASAQKQREFQEPDADALLRRAAEEQAEGNLDAAETLVRESVRASERAGEPGDEGLIGALGALGQLLVAKGETAEARSAFARALEIADSAGGANGPDQLLLLNELSRLHLKESAFAAAEPLLRRLLAMKQGQGAERPEVATVLATLAGVRKALGDHGAAEDLYRQALVIRERTLPPNHLTTAATMESLSEACAARGHFAEAVALSTRALAMRELTLGGGDVTVRAARERIADLLLEAPEGSGSMPPLRSTPPSQPVQATVSLQATASVQRAPREEQYSPPVARPSLDRHRSRASSHQTVALVPWADELMAVQRENAMSAPVPAPTSANPVMRNSVAGRMEARSMTTVATVVIVAILAGIAIASKLGSNDTPTFVDISPSKPPSRLGAASPAAPSAAPVSPPAVDVPQPARNGSVSAAFSAALAPRRAAGVPAVTPGAERVASAPEPSIKPPQLPRSIVPRFSLPDIAAPGRLESGPAARTLTDSFPSRMPMLGRGTTNRGDSDAAPTPPRLIGAVPQPEYPKVLRGLRVQGDVVVQFAVDESGRPDVSSLQVVRSPHEQLTNAVRRVLTQFRFEPARTAAPESRARSETVRYSFSFTAPAR